MTQDEMEQFLKLIDRRIDEKLRSSNIVRKYSAIVTGFDGSLVKARIAGYETEYKFTNRSGQSLSIGDSVSVESTGKVMNGSIVRRFGSG